MKIGKVENLVANLHDKTEYVIHVTNIKSWITFEKVHNVIKFNQNAWLYPYFDMNTDLRKKKKAILKKYSFFLSYQNQIIIIQSFSQKSYW